MNRFATSLLFVLSTYLAQSQVNYTALTQVPAYTGKFGFGSNTQNYPPWNNQQLANIALGNPIPANTPGIGLTALRSSLPEEFLEQYGYNIRIADYTQMGNLGAKNNLVILGFPSAAHRDATFHCSGEQSHLFSDMYLPIWDNNNGTPINENNHFANYIYKTVSTYKTNIRFWEIWNEPDFTFSPNAYSAPGTPGSWWDNNPDPCDLDIKAPITEYIRMLRIAYEVIKTVDPTAYVCTGGIGYPAFLDAILRNTDNPNGGAVNNEFPNKGGAYFDGLSFHSYPHIDGSMWDFVPGQGLVYERNTDRGLQGLYNRKHDLENVLNDYGFNGSTYPKKVWTISETSMPRRPFNVYLGSDLAMSNYILKTMAYAKKEQVDQVYFFTISDYTDEPDAMYEIQMMGLFKNLSSTLPYTQQVTDGGKAMKTASLLLGERKYDAALSQTMAMGSQVDGGAYVGATDTVFMVWPILTSDMTEQGTASFNPSTVIASDSLKLWTWDAGWSNAASKRPTATINLVDRPVFFGRADSNFGPSATQQVDIAKDIIVSPNPVGDFCTITTANAHLGALQHVEAIDALGRKYALPWNSLQTTSFQLPTVSLSSGIYFLVLEFDNQIIVKKIVKN